MPYLFTLHQGVIPPSGSAVVSLPIPRNENYVGLEVHLQAVIGEKLSPPKEIRLTNRDILTLVE
jgi:hypothetical protein